MNVLLRVTRKVRVRMLCCAGSALFGCLVLPVQLGASTLINTSATNPDNIQPFADGFEGSTINPFWTVSGPAVLTSTMAHTGIQSLQMDEGSSIFHALPGQTFGSVTVYFYDDNIVRSTANSFGLFPSSRSDGSAGPYYLALPFGLSDYETGFGSAGVTRSPGWHSFRLDYTPSGGQFLVDSTVVGTWSIPVTFDGIQISNQEGTGATTFIDDFTFTPTATATPEPNSLGLLSAGIVASFIAVRRRRCSKPKSARRYPS